MDSGSPIAKTLREMYDEKKDINTLRHYGARLRARGNYLEALEIFTTTRDDTVVDEICREFFSSCPDEEFAYEVVEKAGFSPTLTLIRERADTMLSEGMYEQAFNSYRRTGETDMMKQCASFSLEEDRLEEAFRMYLELGSENLTGYIARKYFVNSSVTEWATTLLEKADIEADTDLWRQRGDVQLDHDLENAIEAYRKASDVERMYKAMENV